MNAMNQKGLRIVIVGCGKVGNTITEQLVKEGHNITMIDQNADRIAESTGLFDVMGVVGNGASHLVQAEAGVTEADLFIAVTDSDVCRSIEGMLTDKGIAKQCIHYYDRGLV